MNPAWLYILCGLPFAGKSTLAREMVKTLGLAYVEMDAINTERGLGLAGEAISGGDWDITYQECYRRLDHFLGEGRPVIYDAPNFTREQRDQLRAIAQEHGARTKVIFLDIPETMARERWLQNRKAGPRFDVRDDDFAQVVDNFQAPTEDEDVMRYDQSLPVHEWVYRVFKG